MATAAAEEEGPEMSFMLLRGPTSSLAISPSIYARSYGWRHLAFQFAIAAVLSAGPLVGTRLQPANAGSPVKIVALGDSLTAGYGLPDKDGFVPQLQAALTAKGIAVTLANAGVSGDTASDGLARLDWSVPLGTDAVIVELGANDMLRGIKPQVTRDALDAIVRRLTQRHIAVLLCGMRAAPNLGAQYAAAFEPIYPDLAAKYGVLVYPFFLDGVAADLSLTQADGMHPNPQGVGVIVKRMLPKVEELIAHVHPQRPS
jgi:acyl-CoA thioesterase I